MIGQSSIVGLIATEEARLLGVLSALEALWRGVGQRVGHDRVLLP